MLFQVRPGAVICNEAVKQKKKVAKICDNMPKPINVSAIKRKLGRKTIFYRKTFPGVNSVHMNHHPTLLEDKPDIVIVNVRINDVLNRCDQYQIIKNIQQIYITCKNINVNEVSYNFGYCFLKAANNSVINYINENLKVESRTEGYQFLDNEDIKLENLFRGGLTRR